MEEISPDQHSVGSGTRRSSVSSSGRSANCREFLRRFIDSESLASNLDDWFDSLSEHLAPEVPFELVDLQKFDYALEGVPFQQLIRMPSAVYASASDSAEATAYLALEDFLHASVKGLWEAFWSEDDSLNLPFSVACLYKGNMKFYKAEKALANGKLNDLCATAILLRNDRHPHGKWDEVLELALMRPDIGTTAMESSRLPPLSTVGEALYYAIRVLLSRSISRTSFALTSSPVFILLVDSQYGGVVKVEGDVNKLELDVNNVYECAAEWVKKHSKISISPIDRIWNKLGNANWGDVGALQLLFATFHSIVQFAGKPEQSIEDLAADHSSRLHARRIERQFEENSTVNRKSEIVEVEDDSNRHEAEAEDLMKLDIGSVLWLEDTNFQKGYKINEVFINGELPYYVASSVEEDPGKPMFLYVGSRPSLLEPSWEDMNLWYQVQRQTKILTIMKQKGLSSSSNHLPQLEASGRILHPGQCKKPDCDHPWCGTPILVTSPVGELVADMVLGGRFGLEEAIKCCHDCLSALSTAASAGIRHGDIRPENIVYVTSGVKSPYFVLIGWGHAVLEERDRPALNLHFSSTYALQEGKLCSASDAESLVYMIYFSSGGELPELDSVEGALRWRETAWSRRFIQQKLGDISAVLKAFSDYVDSLCGTPYPIDYEIWMRRLRRHIREDEQGKEVEA